MNIKQLKTYVYEAWVRLHTFNGAVVQPENFKSEVRRYGDLRKKSTWKKAVAAFRAQNFFDSNLDNYNLIIWHLSFPNNEWDYEFRYQIMEEFLMLPGGLECVINGLEQIFQYNNTEDKEKANELLKMVAEQSTGTGSIATGFIRQLAGYYTS